MRPRFAVLGAVLAIAGCGSSGHTDTTTTTAAQTATATPAATAAAPKVAKLVYVYRNFEDTGVPEDMTIYVDGTLDYRNLLHTQRSIQTRHDRLPARTLATIKRLLARVDLRHADASGLKPARTGYRWTITVGKRSGTAADGHLTGALKPLVNRFHTVMDHELELGPPHT